MAEHLQRARDMLTGPELALSSYVWLDDQGRRTASPGRRSMLLLTFVKGKGFTSARLNLEDLPQLADVLPQAVLA